MADEIATYSDGPVSGKPVKTGRKLFEQVKASIDKGGAPPAQIAPASVTREDIGDEPKRDPTEKKEEAAKEKATEKAVKDATTKAKKDAKK
ncbi:MULTISPECIES: hypothetical protein [unclassified Aurantimonas]|uniref:hypothetical protein n=1 Tax=unclassified Aurantimonas TaxID=2638230 RepID=UPI002E19DB49|nr:MULTISPECIES: hypothetical protein [unclassified Aurantimonas]MEC5291588.1 hypothetical protein [Aurantimonas sp. C2-3-R2]MEC5412672.1 hypothetical protein [Aurantimonas sp. C2-4-R8]